MKKIKIQYLNDDIKRLEYIDGKSDWIDLRAAEDIVLKKDEFRHRCLSSVLFDHLSDLSFFRSVSKPHDRKQSLPRHSGMCDLSDLLRRDPHAERTETYRI